MRNIEDLNLVNAKNQKHPNYSLEGKQTSIKVCFNDGGQVLIIGEVDNNYIHWASLTDSDDRETNRDIFNYISKGKFLRVTHSYLALQEAGLTYEEVSKWLQIKLTRKPDCPMAWLTPFEGNYGASPSQLEHNGDFFARDISHYLNQVHKKCEFREAGGAYEKVLDYYLTILQDDGGEARYYEKVRKLEEILRKEDYLFASENPGVRQKYIACRQALSTLYNRYMTAVR